MFTEELLAQVPTWLPLRTPIVIVSGVLEIGFVVGNVSQAIEGTSLFALDTDVERWGRLALQPVLVVWALWCTSAWPRAARR